VLVRVHLRVQDTTPSPDDRQQHATPQPHCTDTAIHASIGLHSLTPNHRSLHRPQINLSISTAHTQQTDYRRPSNITQTHVSLGSASSTRCLESLGRAWRGRMCGDAGDRRNGWGLADCSGCRDAWGGLGWCTECLGRLGWGTRCLGRDSRTRRVRSVRGRYNGRAGWVWVVCLAVERGWMEGLVFGE
jgi:hypothetical protein